MSGEEKKAIERIKIFGDSISCSTYPPEAYIGMKDDIEEVLYLIETQQKKISLLKDQLEYVKSEYEETIEHQQKEIEELNKKIQRIYDTQRMIDISDINKSHISFN